MPRILEQEPEDEFVLEPEDVEVANSVFIAESDEDFDPDIELQDHLDREYADWGGAGGYNDRTGE